MEKSRALKVGGTLVWLTLLGLFLSASEGITQTGTPTAHTIFMTAIELKGATTADKLAPPPINPKDLSKGYEFKPPGRGKNEERCGKKAD